MKFDSIILDIDGTIWDTTEVVAAAWNEVIEKFFPQVKRVTGDILKTQFGKTMKVISDNLFPELDDDQKKFLMDQCCINEQAFLMKNTKDLAFENVIEGIKKLAGIIPVYIVSNCQDGYIELVMEKNNITQCISDYECYGKTGLGKGENIKLICKRNNLQNPVYVGDTKGDEEACMEAGVPFVFAEYGFGKSDKYLKKISNFSEIFDLIG